MKFSIQMFFGVPFPGDALCNTIPVVAGFVGGPILGHTACSDKPKCYIKLVSYIILYPISQSH